jgi:hypothetical protein
MKMGKFYRPTALQNGQTKISTTQEEKPSSKETFEQLSAKLTFQKLSLLSEPRKG